MEKDSRYFSQPNNVERPDRPIADSERQLDDALYRYLPETAGQSRTSVDVLDAISPNEINSPRGFSSVNTGGIHSSAMHNLAYNAPVRILNRTGMETDAISMRSSPDQVKSNFLDLPPEKRPKTFLDKSNTFFVEIPEIIRNHIKKSPLSIEFLAACEKMRSESGLTPFELSKRTGIIDRSLASWLDAAEDEGLNKGEWKYPYSQIERINGPNDTAIEVPLSIRNRKNGDYPNKEFLQGVVDLFAKCDNKQIHLINGLGVSSSSIRKWRKMAREKRIKPSNQAIREENYSGRSTSGQAGPSTFDFGPLDERSRAGPSHER
ncbi:MAG: hypothetical protein AAGA53_11900 [Pseudomonadota bacterium]